MLPDIPRIPPPDTFVQPFDPPSPDSLKPSTPTIAIPTTLNSNNKFPEAFDPSSLDQLPVARLQTRPVYPLEMRRTGQSGPVTVGFIVDAHGEVQNAYVISSSQREFESAAVLAVAKWKFNPGRRCGKDVATRRSVPMHVNLASD